MQYKTPENQGLADLNKFRIQKAFSGGLGRINYEMLRNKCLPLGERLGVSPHDAEDVLHNVLITIYQNGLPHCDTLIEPNNLLGEQRVRNYLMTIYVNSVRDVGRRTKRNPVQCSIDVNKGNEEEPYDNAVALGLHTTERGAPDSLALNELSEYASVALDELSPPLRDVVISRFYNHMDYASIAQQLKIPVGTVKSRLNTAIHQLRKIIMDQTGDDIKSLEKACSL